MPLTDEDRRKGGRSRAAKLSPDRRRAIAHSGGAALWRKIKKQVRF